MTLARLCKAAPLSDDDDDDEDEGNEEERAQQQEIQDNTEMDLVRLCSPSERRPADRSAPSLGARSAGSRSV
jgi:hypothetical protein